MTLPATLNSDFYQEVWHGPLVVVGAARHGSPSKSKTFHALLEVGDQCKHDNSMRAYCIRRGVTHRRTQDTQVRPENDGSLAYYRDKGEVACRRVARYMHDRWDTNKVNSSVFNPAGSETLTVQGEAQSDGWYYEMSMYYRGGDVYVAFHCYPPKR